MQSITVHGVKKEYQYILTLWLKVNYWSMFWQKLISDIFKKMSLSHFSSCLLKMFYLKKNLSVFSIIFWQWIAYDVALDNRAKSKFTTLNVIFSKWRIATYQLLPKRASIIWMQVTLHFNACTFSSMHVFNSMHVYLIQCMYLSYCMYIEFDACIFNADTA